MIKSTLSDTTIMEETIKGPPDSKGRVQLQYTLPSGREVVSVPTVEEEIKGSVLIGWCNTVRAEDEYDERLKQEAAVAKETLNNSSGAPSRTGADAKREDKQPGSTPSGVGPEDLALNTYNSFLVEVDRILDEQKGLEERLKVAQKELSKWKKVLEGLEISLSSEYSRDVLARQDSTQK